MFILDTNVVSELRKRQAAPAVVAWAAKVPVVGLYLCSITLLELELGVLLAERKDARAGEALRKWLEGSVLLAFQSRVLPVDAQVARCSARLHVPDRRPERDALMAGCALVHGMTVVTRNVADFRTTGVQLVNPWH